MSRRKAKPTRYLLPQSSALPAYGPQVKSLYPRLMASPDCSWCGTEMLDRAGAKVCPDCDLAPAKTP